MAPGRVYRDYYSGAEPIILNAPRSPSTEDMSSSSRSARSSKPPVRLGGGRQQPDSLIIPDSADGAHDNTSTDDASSALDVYTPVHESKTLRDSATALPTMSYRPKREPDAPTSTYLPARAVTIPDSKSSSSVPRAPRRLPKPERQVPNEQPELLEDGIVTALPTRPATIVAPPSNLPEFFSRTVFHTVLSNPAIVHQLLKFGQSRLCGESIEFLARVSRYQNLLQELSQTISSIHSDFLVEGAPSEINVPQSVLTKVNSDVKSTLALAMPKLESIFGHAQADVEQLIYGDVYPGFVRHQMSLSAARALGTNRAKYGGLGDCFVLTDPAKADNPIVFASDGFVKVTGYPRADIIPRNCRFLQGFGTDRAAVRRIKQAVNSREESVELLLNQRKDGEPFWNLLYTTPLFDSNGKLVFFLGAQVNCSTTIHSTSDVLRILAQSDGDGDARSERATSSGGDRSKSEKSRRLLRGSSKSTLLERVPGMEDTLLEKMESMPLQTQFRAFRSAYSNFIIVNYSTMLIAFVSAGIADMLFPIRAKSGARDGVAAGSDIFKFLSNHGTGSLTWDFKSAVKTALKAGQAVSLDVKLCAKPLMGFERFLCHWTPLKDERGAVVWVVLTLGSERG